MYRLYESGDIYMTEYLPNERDEPMRPLPRKKTSEQALRARVGDRFAEKIKAGHYRFGFDLRGQREQELHEQRMRRKGRR